MMLQESTTQEILDELQQRGQIYLLILRNTEGKSIDCFVAEKISGQVDRELGNLFTLVRDHLHSWEIDHPFRGDGQGLLEEH